MLKTLIMLYDRSFCFTAITPNPGRSSLGWLVSMVRMLEAAHSIQSINWHDTNLVILVNHTTEKQSELRDITKKPEKKKPNNFVSQFSRDWGAQRGWHTAETVLQAPATFSRTKNPWIPSEVFESLPLDSKNSCGEHVRRMCWLRMNSQLSAPADSAERAGLGCPGQHKSWPDHFISCSTTARAIWLVITGELARESVTTT